MLMKELHSSPEYPQAPLDYLETLWFQVAGTLCNLACSHCLVSANPTNKTHLMMPLEKVKAVLKEADDLGVREYYFTGGEPFMNRDMLDILKETLKLGPANVLTNGTLIDDRLAARLKNLSDESDYSLELRVSMDGTTAAANDPIRGAGTFDRIIRGIKCLSNAGLNPVITVTEASPELEKQNKKGREQFYSLLKEIGLNQPRLKILSLFHIGEEENRTCKYKESESLRGMHLNPDELSKLQCTTSRIVTNEGWYVCPILVNNPRAKMGETLNDAMATFRLDESACYTCYAFGVTCRT